LNSVNRIACSISGSIRINDKLITRIFFKIGWL
jgi:hypothetical protein